MRPKHGKHGYRRAIGLGLAGWFFGATVALAQSDEAIACQDLPQTAGGLALLMVIEPDGSVSACRADATTSAARIYDPRPGFLCVFVKADARPTVTAIEGPLSSRVDRVVIDGQEQAEGAPGYPHLHLRDVIGRGPSGARYDIVVETIVAGVRYATTLNVTAEQDRQISFNSVRVGRVD